MTLAFDRYRAWKTWDNRPFGLFTWLDARAFEVELGAAGIDLSRRLSILEIGFGAGTFAGWARDRGYAYAGVELDPALVARARRAGFEAMGADRPLAQLAPACRFDLVVAFDVLEHMRLDEIQGLLDAVYDRLKADGRLVARFPSGDSPFAGSIQNGDITHRISIGSGMVEQLALQAGYAVIQIRAPRLPVFGVGVVRGLRRGLLSAARLVVGRAINLVFHDNQRRVVDPNMVIVLAKADDAGRGEAPPCA